MKPLKKGFTLIELLIVILIISTLLTISFTTYQHYKEKAILTQYGMDFAKNCMGSLLAYCFTNPNGTIDNTTAPECNRSYTVDGYSFTISADRGQCKGSELPDNYTVRVTSSNFPNVELNCIYKADMQSYKCTVEIK